MSNEKINPKKLIEKLQNYNKLLTESYEYLDKNKLITNEIKEHLLLAVQNLLGIIEITYTKEDQKKKIFGMYKQSKLKQYKENEEKILKFLKA